MSFFHSHPRHLVGISCPGAAMPVIVRSIFRISLALLIKTHCCRQSSFFSIVRNMLFSSNYYYYVTHVICTEVVHRSFYNKLLVGHIFLINMYIILLLYIAYYEFAICTERLYYIQLNNNNFLGTYLISSSATSTYCITDHDVGKNNEIPLK